MSSSSNTVSDNLAANGVASAGVNCQAASSIVYANPGGAVNGNCSFAFSNIEGAAQANGNIDVNPMFANAAAGNFHLQPNSQCIDAAAPAATLAIDFGGDARPQGAGRDMGADEVTP